MTETTAAEDQIAAALGHVAEMFGAVCGDPDNRSVAQSADQALRTLDDLLATIE